MINYDGYVYDENCVFGKQSKKDRLEKQLGDFGEQLVMTLLGRIAQYSVAYVDHEGADLIVTDSKNRYAVSVKTAQFGRSESETKVFKTNDQKKLCKFAKDFDLIPAVAMVIIPKDFAFIDLYLLTLDGFMKLATLESNVIEKEAIKVVDRGLQINNYSLGTGKNNIKHGDKKGYLKYLHNNELIKHIRMDVQNRENFSSGIKQVSENGDVICFNKLLDKSSNNDGNLSRQLGDAGEYILAMLLGQQKNYKVARVDHVGADLIATDMNGKKYAISVKTNKHSSYEFLELYTNEKSVKRPKRELGKLKEFSEKYDMIPVVACIFIKDGFKGMDIYISSLDNWIKTACFNDSKAISYNAICDIIDINDAIDKWSDTMSSFKIDATKEEYKRFLRSVEGIESIEVDFSGTLSPEMKWK